MSEPRFHPGLALAVACCLFLFPGSLFSEEVPRWEEERAALTEPGGDDKTPSFEPGGKAGPVVLPFPSGDVYPSYAADPTRVGFGVEGVRVLKGEIPDTSQSRVNLRAGGTLGLIRVRPADQPDSGWQLSLMGGFNDQNDIRNSLDNIGWDGHYGLLLTAAPVSPALAVKAGVLHVSSHLGDEYIERTGRTRIGYTRQELAVGISWRDNAGWRTYAETGWAFFMGNKELQRHWRTQFGAEYESAPRQGTARAGWYAAFDGQSFQERDWRIDLSIQSGFVYHSGERTWRLGLQWYSGRPPIGEFFQYSERYLSLGLWIDI